MGGYYSQLKTPHCKLSYTSCGCLLTSCRMFFVRDMSVHRQGPAVQGNVRSSMKPKTFRDAQELQLAEDTLMQGRSIIDAAHETAPGLAYKPVRGLVPMLNDRNGPLAFYMPGWLRCTSTKSVALPERDHFDSTAIADQCIKDAGAQAIAMVGDESEAWVQTSLTQHPTYGLHQEHALLGSKAMHELGFHFDTEFRAFHAVTMRIKGNA